MVFRSPGNRGKGLRAMEQEEPSLQGFVVITLPPPDNPSVGKKITVYTVSDSPQQTLESNETQLQQNQQYDQEPGNSQAIGPPYESHNQLSISMLTFAKGRRILSLLGIALCAFILWNSLSSETLTKIREFEDDHERGTFVLPLYPKLGSRGADVELKLGRFVQRKNGVGPSKTVSRLDSSTVLPLNGNVYPYGLYFTYLLVGEPARPYFLDIDTGSDLIWIQCDAPCTSCAKGPHPLYKPTMRNLVPSKDFLCLEVQRNLKTVFRDTNQQCDYEIEYADRSSTTGVLVKDKQKLAYLNGSLIQSNIIFGCAYDQQGSLLDSLVKTDGILGLSRGKVSLPNQLASQGIINNVFGHCLPAELGSDGYMFLGDELMSHQNMAWVSMLESPGKFYAAKILRMSLGSREIRLDGLGRKLHQIVFDSGSSYTYIPNPAYKDLIASLQEMCGQRLTLDVSDPTLPLCWQSGSPIRSVADVKHLFKPLVLHFRSKWSFISTKFQIPPEGYLVMSSTGNVCLGILDGSNVQDGSNIVLGDVSLRGKLVVYDNVKQKLGWTQSDCKKPRTKKLPVSAGLDLPI